MVSSLMIGMDISESEFIKSASSFRDQNVLRDKRMEGQISTVADVLTSTE